VQWRCDHAQDCVEATVDRSYELHRRRQPAALSPYSMNVANLGGNKLPHLNLKFPQRFRIT